MCHSHAAAAQALVGLVEAVLTGLQRGFRGDSPFLRRDVGVNRDNECWSFFNGDWDKRHDTPVCLAVPRVVKHLKFGRATLAERGGEFGRRRGVGLRAEEKADALADDLLGRIAGESGERSICEDDRSSCGANVGHG
jgi:hypothetical protein